MIRPLLLVAAAAHVVALAPSAAAQATLQPFRDEAEIAEFHRQRALERQRRTENVPPPSHVELMNSAHAYTLPPPNPEPPGTPRQQERPVDRDWMIPAAQQTGGDPRETVAAAGEHLVVLRRGRLFSFRIAPDGPRLVSAVETAAFPSRLLTRYDELLASGQHVVVIGSSMQRNGTELGVFRLAPDGRLAHRATYSLTSGDDIAWHTYAARLQGGRLVLYAPLDAGSGQPATQRPALHRWDEREDSVSQFAPATRVYRPAGQVSAMTELKLHTVGTCDLPCGDDVRCAFTGFYAPAGRALHVSPTAAYVWAPQGEGARPELVLYRLPLDGSAPTALRVSGTPEGPSAFLESADGHLNVLVWSAPGRLALLRVPLAEFGDGSRAAAPERYHALPWRGGGELTAGYVGNWLIYGPAPRLGESITSAGAVAVRWADPGRASLVALPHAVERVEALGPGALVIGGDGDSLHLSTVLLGRDTATLVDRHAVPGSGHLARHGVVYRADGPGAGVLAVPVRGPERPRDAPWLYGPGGIRFLRSRDLRLQEVGELAAGAFPGDDACMRGCRNWFGDTRAVFQGGRILALLGYEVVEAREAAGRIREVRRAGFFPAPPTADLSGEWTFHEDIHGGSRYYCRNQGTMRFDRAGDSLAMRYRQTGECRIDGATTRSDGEGSAAGRVWPSALAFHSGPCRYEGALNTLNSVAGSMECRIPMPDGSVLDVRGSWSARRPPP